MGNIDTAAIFYRLRLERGFPCQMVSVDTAKITIFRHAPGENHKPTYTTYTVPVEGRMTILQALEYIYTHQDSTLGFPR